MNFAVFYNAWNLNSHEIRLSDKDDSSSGTWHLVNLLMRKYVLEKIESTGSLISSPGSDFPILVQLVTEPLAWYSLIIQSCIRSLLPSGKKKKKGGLAEQINSRLFHDLQNAIQSVCDIIQMVAKWLSDQIDQADDENFEAMFSSIRRDASTGGPGKVFQILSSSMSVMEDSELGERISQALQSWSPADVTRKIINGQTTLISEFLKICKLKVKSLQALKLQI